MSRTKVIALGLVGTVLPVVLGLTAYMISRSTIGSAGTVPSLTHAPAQSASSSPSPEASAGQREDRKGSGETSSPQPEATATDDNGGRCSEPEHANDPTCSIDDSSGEGGGGGGGDDSSPNSGHGSGDD
jgi:hypothetical protein